MVGVCVCDYAYGSVFFVGVAGYCFAEEDGAALGYGGFFYQVFHALGLPVLGASHVMSSSGLSVCMVTFIGPRGDSPVSWQNEAWPAKATCLLR